jgi:hypothetical protein
MTDQTLKLALAGLLKERIEYNPSFDSFFWKEIQPVGGQMIRETEWDCIVRLIRKGLTTKEQDDVLAAVWKANAPRDYQEKYFWKQDDLAKLIWRTLAFASWQQKATAILTIKGIL